MLQNFKESTSIDNKSNFSNLFLRDHFHNLNKKKKKLLLLLSSKHLGILLESAVSPGWGPSTSLCLHICVIRLPFQQTCFIFQQFFFSSSFFIYKLRPLSLSLSARIIATDITRSKRRDRGWWNVIADLRCW